MLTETKTKSKSISVLELKLNGITKTMPHPS